MRHKERVMRMISSFDELEDRLRRHDPNALPEGVDIKKLERAYDLITGYEFRLVKKERTGTA